MDDPVITPEADDTFECAQRTDIRLPNDFHEWPEPYLKASDAAIARLLKRRPGAVVISDTSECIDDSHPRFPVGDDNKGKFFAIRTVKLDEPDHSEPNEAEFSTAERLRLFEDERLGPDHLRHNHQVEKGIGSPFSMLTDKERAHHAALEHLIAVEKEHAAAEAHMAGVHAKLEAAVARASDTEEAL